MGLAATLRVLRPGYVPRGAGEIELRIEPVPHTLKPLTLTEPGRIRRVSGIALSSHLEERQVSERMAQVCEQQLAAAELSATIERVADLSPNTFYDKDFGTKLPPACHKVKASLRALRHA
jgi:RNA 3'-terminal phosphate cyclase (ATP)